MKRQTNMCQKSKVGEPISVLQPARVSSMRTKRITTRATAARAGEIAPAAASQITTATESLH